MALPLILTLISTGLTVASQVAAGQAQKQQFKRRAEEEKFAAEGRELERRRKMNRILSQNIVAGQVAGIKGEGTPASLALTSAEQASLSEQVTGASERMRERALIVAGRNAAAASRVQAASTLLSSASNIAKSGALSG